MYSSTFPAHASTGDAAVSTISSGFNGSSNGSSTPVILLTEPSRFRR